MSKCPKINQKLRGLFITAMFGFVCVWSLFGLLRPTSGKASPDDVRLRKSAAGQRIEGTGQLINSFLLYVALSEKTSYFSLDGWPPFPEYGWTTTKSYVRSIPRPYSETITHQGISGLLKVASNSTTLEFTDQETRVMVRMNKQDRPMTLLYGEKLDLTFSEQVFVLNLIFWCQIK